MEMSPPRPPTQIHPDADAIVGIEDEVARVSGIRNAADAQLVSLVAEALRDDLWQGWGIHTPVQWLMWRAGLQRSTATRIVSLARRAEELPVTMDSFAEGRLSLDQAATVARFTPAAFDASVCELAQNATVAQIAKATRRYDFDTNHTPPPPGPGEPEPEPPDPDPTVTEERSVAFGTDDTGWWARIQLPVEEGLTLEAALKTAREHLHRVDPDARLCWANALLALARTTLAHDAAGSERPIRTKVIVHLETALGGLPGRDANGWIATLPTGEVLPTAVRRYLTCDADAQVIRLQDGRPVDIGRTHHDPPEALRRFVEHRDPTCRVPGCDSRLWLHNHHVVHWEDGGETTSANICRICPRHHRLHHKGLLGIEGDADGELTFTDHRGRRLVPAGKPRPPDPDDAPRTQPYTGPTGERLDPTAVFFTPRAA